MQIVLNGRSLEVTCERLDGLLEELGYVDTKVATAVNGRFVARQARVSKQLRPGDRVEVIAPMQGG